MPALEATAAQCCDLCRGSVGSLCFARRLLSLLDGNDAFGIQCGQGQHECGARAVGDEHVAWYVALLLSGQSCLCDLANALLTHAALADDMIASRQKERKQQQKKKMVPQVSAADRAMGNARARRTARMNFHRGITTTPKPTPQQIATEVERQVQITKKKQPKPDLKKLRGPERAAARKEQLEAMGKRPSKKAVKAAVAAMEEKGFKLPEGMQMTITLTAAPDAKPAAQPKKKSPPKQQKTQQQQQQQQQKKNPPTNNAKKGGRRGKK